MEQDIKTIISRIYAQAKHLNACDKFTGEEDLEALVRLFLSPQGIEFCIAHHFPNSATFRLFKPYQLERYGIYIDAGDITLRNPEKAVIIGRTQATVFCDTNTRHEVVVLHGAKALVSAARWAVVFTTVEPGSSCLKSTTDNAIIIG